MIKGYVNSSDLKIYYEDSQTSLEPILFLHGNNEDHTYFKTIREYFENYYRLIFIDSRDHGLSSKSDDNLDFEVMAKDVYEVIKKINVNKLNIIGFSDGASIALQLTLDHPEIVNSLVLVGANYNVQGLKKDILNKIKKDYMKNSLLASINEKEKDLKKKNLLMLKHPNFHELELNKISCNVLNVFGSNDCIEIEHSKKLSTLLKAKEIVFDNASHDLILEYPDLFAERVKTFIRSNENCFINDDVGLVNYEYIDSFINYLDYKDDLVKKAMDLRLEIKNINEFEKYFQSINYEERLTILDLKNYQRVGFIGLVNGELVIRIFSSFRKKGYGFKAINTFIKYLINKGYSSLRINIMESNKNLENLVKKCGFNKDYLDKTIISKRTNDVITLHSYVFRLDK
ncbi:MAG: alpha/beta fold hydrolase [Bacilli bacterium]|nr:alpha/beta fold hydrolase [Bacilli bacterium]